jgi:hypothetical protein
MSPGAPPPPPPPPSRHPGFKALKIRNKPAKKLRPLFWNKLNNANLSNTVWSDFSAAIEFDLGDLESSFTVENTPSTPSQISVASAKKQNVTTVLDINRANHIGQCLLILFCILDSDYASAIMLSRIKLGYPQIRKALLNIDDSKLSVDDLKAISKQLPTLEEV